MNIESFSWEELNAFEFNEYPHELTVSTNASEADFQKAWRIFNERCQSGDMINIEEVLREMGFAAITAQTFKTTKS